VQICIKLQTETRNDSKKKLNNMATDISTDGNLLNDKRIRPKTRQDAWEIFQLRAIKNKNGAETTFSRFLVHAGILMKKKIIKKISSRTLPNSRNHLPFNLMANFSLTDATGRVVGDLRDSQE
jgi:hypothetical protein